MHATHPCNVINPAPERSWYLFNVIDHSPERSWYLSNVTNPLPGRTWYLFATATNPQAKRTLDANNHALAPSLGPRNVLATLLDAVSAASGATQRSCNAPSRCNCYFLAPATLLQPSWTLQLLLLGCCFWGHAALLQDSWTLQLLLPGF